MATARARLYAPIGHQRMQLRGPTLPAWRRSPCKKRTDAEATKELLLLLNAYLPACPALEGTI